MKRTTTYSILGLVLLAFLSACSGSDGSTVEPQPEVQQAITFVGGMQEAEAVTRADQGLEEVLDTKTFKAWGYKNMTASGSNFTDCQIVIPGYDVTYGDNTAYTTTSNTNDWEYVGGSQEIKYWDMQAVAYRFFGYAKGNATVSPATEPADVAVANGSVTDAASADAVTFSATVDASSDATVAAAPYFSELWFSMDRTVEDAERRFGKPVRLRFLKPLTRVRFMFTFAEDLTFGREEVSNVSFHPTRELGVEIPQIATKGTVAVSYPLKGTETKESWSVQTVTGAIPSFTIDYYEEPSSSVTPADALPTTWPNTPGKWYYVLPVQSQGSYTVEAAVVTTEVKSAVVPAEYMSWKAGYEYTYIFKILDGGDITIDVIQVAINDWKEKAVIDRPVFNW